jgi:hypothetical protein
MDRIFKILGEGDQKLKESLNQSYKQKYERISECLKILEQKKNNSMEVNHDGQAMAQYFLYLEKEIRLIMKMINLKRLYRKL